MRYETYLRKITRLDRKIAALLAREERLKTGLWYYKFLPGLRDRAIAKSVVLRRELAAQRSGLEAAQFGDPALLWNGNPGLFRALMPRSPGALAALAAAADAALSRRG